MALSRLERAMRTFEAVAPVRLDLAGGTLDIWPLHLLLPPPVVTLNVALDLPAHVRVEVGPAGGGTGGAVTIESEDQGVACSYEDRAALERDLDARRCPLDLLGRALREAGPPGGTAVKLKTRASSPKGAGLGGSSALLVAALGALDAAAARTRSATASRRLAQDLEAACLGGPTGYQDYYPALLGGCLALEGRPGGVAVERLDVDLDGLAARLRLVDTGAPHVSGITNWGVLRAFLDGEPGTREAISGIAHHAARMRDALRRGDLDEALVEVVEEGALRRRLAPGVATERIEVLDRTVRAAGAVGTKICGAGGGGCVVVVLPAAGADGVDGALRDGGFAVLPVRLVAEGLRVAEVS